MTTTRDASYDVALQRAEDAFASGNVREAARLLYEVRRAHRPDVRLLVDLGVVLAACGTPERAARHFEAALRLDPRAVVARENLVAVGEPPRPDPEWSVVVPSHDRPDRVHHLLAALDRQDVDPGTFEVVIADDGSPSDLREACAGVRVHFEWTIIRRQQGGPAAARNTAISAARGRRLLILNDDAVPAPDLVRRHEEGHRLARASLEGTLFADAAVLGAFPFTAEARRAPLVRHLERTGVLFPYHELKQREVNDWFGFWTCNISLERRHVVAAGGFDESFTDAMSEDIELGWRLQRDRDLGVYLHPDAVCEHDHVIDVAAFKRRQIAMGRNHYRLYRKYGNASVLLTGGLGPIDDAYFERVRRRRDHVSRAAAEAERLLVAWNDERLALDESRVAGAVKDLSDFCFLDGLLEERSRTVSASRDRRGVEELSGIV